MNDPRYDFETMRVNRRKLILSEVDKSLDPVRGIAGLRMLYSIPGEGGTAIGRAIGDDRECFEWMCDFWDYVLDNETNPGLLSE